MTFDQIISCIHNGAPFIVLNVNDECQLGNSLYNYMIASVSVYGYHAELDVSTQQVYITKRYIKEG